MTKTIFSLLIWILFTTTLVKAELKPYVISGFDDVLRQAENTSVLKATLKILENDKGFSGMPELYQSISNQETTPRFEVVSAISNWFDTRIDSFLMRSHFPSNHRYLRNWLTEWSIESFKIEKISEILKNKPDRKFIVIFDNSNASINLANEITQQFSKNIVAIYLRQVIKKELPLEAIGFYTAFDIAVNEYEAGRLSSKDVSKVGQTILNEQNVDSLIPDYATCPLIYNPCKVPASDIKEICINVTHHVQNLCKH